jgi:hypothetical protein
MTVAHDTGTAILGPQIGMLGEKLGDLGLDGLGQKRARPRAQHLGERIFE